MKQLTTAATAQGVFRGCSRENHTLFKGIPFAGAPIGELRFEPASEPASFNGMKNADSFPPIAMQHFTDPVGMYQKEFYSNPDYQFPISEDCLYLNIWTPAASPEDHLPVVVWIHGGGLEHGFATELEFDGEAYCKKGIILVTVAYRVNIFGFLYTKEQETRLGHSGNQGLLDQIQALKWVYENIRAFGGDPENITLMGQSAGAISTQVLALSPLSSPYIKRAILQSGGGLEAFDDLYLTKEQALAVTEKAYELCGVSSLEELKQLPGDFLLEKADDLMSVCPGIAFRPVIDGYVLPEHPTIMVQKGMLAKIPYLIGSTKDDLFIPEGAASHREGSFHKAAVAYAKMCSSLHYPPVYVYEFCHDLPGSSDGAFHSSELWYTFGTLARCWRPMEESDYSLSEDMVTCWSNFIKTGDPNTPGSSEWKPYTSDTCYIRTFR